MYEMRAFSPIAHLWSQYGWTLLILSFFSLRWILPMTRDSGPVKSARHLGGWMDSRDPIVFGHLTDVHVSAAFSAQSEKITKAVSNYRKLGIDTLIITGDLVDNWGEPTVFRYGNQIERDFQTYHELTDDVFNKFKTVIDMAGNHDEFGIFSFNSKQHHFLNYSHFYSKMERPTIEDFWVSVVETDDVIFVPLNPFRYPVAHAKFDFWARETREILDLIERALERANECGKPIFAACHYPVNFWVMTNVRSTSGRSFKEIISNGNVSLFLSGHAHPDHSQFSHHNGMLEVIAADLGSHDSYSLVTIDNDRTVHWTYNIEEVPEVILTNPIPATMLTNSVKFSESATPVRLIASNPSLNLFVRGAVEGKLVYTRELKTGMHLYSLAMPRLGSGFHQLEIYGDWKHNVSFFVGNMLPSFQEEVYGHANSFMIASVFSVVVGACNIFILAPFDFGIHFGVRDRLRSLPTWLRRLLLFALLAPFIVPISFVDIEGHFGFNFIYGYFAGSSAFYDIWGQLICMLYEVCIVLLGSLLASGIAVSVPWHPIFIIDILAAAGGFGYGLYFVTTSICEASGIVRSFTSPLFVIIPIILYVSIAWWRLTDGRRVVSDFEKKKT